MIQVALVACAAYLGLFAAEYFGGRTFALGVAVGGFFASALMLIIRPDRKSSEDIQ